MCSVANVVTDAHMYKEIRTLHTYVLVRKPFKNIIVYTKNTYRSKHASY